MTAWRTLAGQNLCGSLIIQNLPEIPEVSQRPRHAYPSNFRASKSLQNARIQTKLLCQSGVDEGRKDEVKKDEVKKDEVKKDDAWLTPSLLEDAISR